MLMISKVYFLSNIHSLFNTEYFAVNFKHHSKCWKKIYLEEQTKNESKNISKYISDILFFLFLC